MAEDASVVFYNPAAMTELDRAQMTVGFTYINGVGEFTGDATNVGGFDITGADDSDIYSDGGNYLGESFIPFFYYVRPINDKFSVGLGVYVPFGTNTDYDNDFVGGGFADETSLTSLEITPTFAYKVNDQLSIGGGIDIVYMKGLLSKYVDSVPYYAAAAAGYQATYDGNIAGGATDAQATAAAEAAVDGLTADSPLLNSDNAGFENHYEVEGDDWGYGWNLGAYYKLSEATTLGLTYRSEIEITLVGDSEFSESFEAYDKASDTVISYGDIRPQGSEVPITTPASATFSVVHQATDKLLLQAGTTWTGWSSFESFDVIATENITDGTAIDISDISYDSNNGLDLGYIGYIDESWTDVWALALGGTYQLNDKVVLRAGYAYDQSPVDDDHRTARVPSSDRQWLTFGVGYIINADLSFDVAAGYLFMNKMDLFERNKRNDNTYTESLTSITGEYEIDVFGLSAQVNYKF
jgi:long-chain fatty acid transport protein